MAFKYSIPKEIWDKYTMCKDRNYKLPFGKHKNRTIQEIYQGRKKIPSDIEEIIINNKLSTIIDTQPIYNRTYPIDSPYEISFLHSIAGDEISDADKNLLNSHGYPDYIEWCIINGNFCIKETELDYLETLPVYTIDSIFVKKFFIDPESQLVHINYNFVINERYYVFSNYARLKNSKRN